MTDCDVVQHVALLWGVSVYVMRPRGASKKVAYRTTLLGQRAAEWMRRVYPFMGLRRRAQIDTTLNEWDALPSANERRRLWSSQAAADRNRDPNGRFT
jgi:hypothetical protein